MGEQMQILSCHMHLAKEKILFQSSYSGSLWVMGGKNGVVCQWDFFSLPEEYHSSLGRGGSICCMLEHDTKTGIIFEAVWFPKP